MRTVPVHPELVAILRAHVAEFGPTIRIADSSEPSTADRSPALEAWPAKPGDSLQDDADHIN
jgi:hypothetical protein